MTKDEYIDQLIVERDDLAFQLDVMTGRKRAAGARAARVSAFLATVTPDQFKAIPRDIVSWRARGFSKNQARALSMLLAIWQSNGK